MNHGDRTLPAPAVSEAEAAAQVDGSLTVLAHQLALIPTGGEYEVLCHEFKCQNASGGHVLVYVDAADGRQERILLLQEDENGTLVI
jgi:spore germination protein